MTHRKYFKSLGYDVPLTMTVGENVYYYHTDANKNVIALTDSQGNVVESNEYSPFGKLISSTGTIDNPFKFSSEYYDSETELAYYNYRYYNPQLGRWMSRDPIEEKGGWNLYGMVGNDLCNGWDNLGLSDWRWGWYDLLPFVPCVHFGYDIAYGPTKYLFDLKEQSSRMNNTDRENYHERVMNGTTGVTTQAPSINNDMNNMK